MAAPSSLPQERVPGQGPDADALRRHLGERAAAKALRDAKRAAALRHVLATCRVRIVNEESGKDVTLQNLAKFEVTSHVKWQFAAEREERARVARERDRQMRGAGSRAAARAAQKRRARQTRPVDEARRDDEYY